MFNHILVPLDQSSYAERALTYAEALAKAGGRRLSLIAAVAQLNTENDPQLAQIDDLSRQRAQRYLLRQAERLKAAGLDDVETDVRFGEPAGCIIEAARERRADLIAISTLGAGATGRFTLGSVALKVLMTAPCPVLAVPAGGE